MKPGTLMDEMLAGANERKFCSSRQSLISPFHEPGVSCARQLSRPTYQKQTSPCPEDDPDS